MSPGPSLIREGAEALEVALSEDAAATLWTLVERMLKWNRRINIVGPCDATQAIDRHIHDGLALLRLLDTPDVRAVTTEWTDIGAGGGFPGLVLAIAGIVGARLGANFAMKIPPNVLRIVVLVTVTSASLWLLLRHS